MWIDKDSINKYARGLGSGKVTDVYLNIYPEATTRISRDVIGFSQSKFTCDLIKTFAEHEFIFSEQVYPRKLFLSEKR